METWEPRIFCLHKIVLMPIRAQRAAAAKGAEVAENKGNQQKTAGRVSVAQMVTAKAVALAKEAKKRAEAPQEDEVEQVVEESEEETPEIESQPGEEDSEEETPAENDTTSKQKPSTKTQPLPSQTRHKKRAHTTTEEDGSPDSDLSYRDSSSSISDDSPDRKRRRKEDRSILDLNKLIGTVADPRLKAPLRGEFESNRSSNTAIGKLQRRGRLEQDIFSAFVESDGRALSFSPSLSKKLARYVLKDMVRAYYEDMATEAGLTGTALSTARRLVDKADAASAVALRSSLLAAIKSEERVTDHSVKKGYKKDNRFNRRAHRPRTAAKDSCHHCGRVGHFVKNCPDKPNESAKGKRK